ncbi:c-type cytochrome [Marinimicrococcus flavescens]|uniref:Cytochrome c n=1 Tax=Marinimicrococcus flavescens TaxID=3031815 RepID=A0AAP3V2H3_9PROT|nr:cytochrome c [Marinimicrococcus flavescens]
MSRRLLSPLLAMAAALAWPAAAADPELAAPVKAYEGAELDFTLRCKGCHGFEGQGTEGHVPRLKGFVGLYTHLPDGREFLLRVPGVARSRLDDERLAAVLNWMLATYGPEPAPGFAPFTPGEVAQARVAPFPDPLARRARLVAELHERGLLPAGDDGMGISAEARAAR